MTEKSEKRRRMKSERMKNERGEVRVFGGIALRVCNRVFMYNGKCEEINK